MESMKLSVTVRANLMQKYDAAALAKIDTAVASWIAADAARNIKTVHVAVDDTTKMAALGVKALKGKVTARKIKLAIDALWKKLSPDYLVLFGADDVVPYFVVDNPTYDPNGDDDKDVSTDNPYATSKAFKSATLNSYLVPERTVGRIPDMVGDGDPAWFVDYLRTCSAHKPQPKGFYANAYAICCDEWQGAGQECISTIGENPGALFISPPVGDGTTKARSRLKSRLHMIKCHGSQLDPNFYGQRGESYPVALFSKTLKPRVKTETVAAAMCCYGAQVYSPEDPAAQVSGAWPVSSTYLRGGALGFAGSTKIAWVGVDGMMCADWVVASYLKAVLGGASMGRAFLESKQDYLRWVSQQGHAPDIADQKTMIEYVLLADPSLHPVASTPAVPAGMVRAAALKKSSPLALQERRQRRIMRAGMASQIRGMLPIRSIADAAARRLGSRLFGEVQKLLKKGVKGFQITQSPTIAHKVETAFGGAPQLPVRAGRMALAAMPPSRRESYEYYWSGRRITKGHKEVRLVKVETDTEGRVLRSSVVHSS